MSLAIAGLQVDSLPVRHTGEVYFLNFCSIPCTYFSIFFIYALLVDLDQSSLAFLMLSNPNHLAKFPSSRKTSPSPPHTSISLLLFTPLLWQLLTHNFVLSYTCCPHEQKFQFMYLCIFSPNSLQATALCSKTALTCESSDQSFKKLIACLSSAKPLVRWLKHYYLFLGHNSLY